MLLAVATLFGIIAFAEYHMTGGFWRHENTGKMLYSESECHGLQSSVRTCRLSNVCFVHVGERTGSNGEDPQLLFFARRGHAPLLDAEAMRCSLRTYPQGAGVLNLTDLEPSLVPQVESGAAFGPDEALWLDLGLRYTGRGLNHFGHALTDDLYPAWYTMRHFGELERMRTATVLLSHPSAGDRFLRKWWSLILASPDGRKPRGQVLDVKTAFSNKTAALAAAAVTEDKRQARAVCFKTLIYGMGEMARFFNYHNTYAPYGTHEKTFFAQAPLLREFADFTLAALGFEPRTAPPQRHSVVLLAKTDRRRIVNLSDLAGMLRRVLGTKADVRLVNPAALTLREQARLMQGTTVAVSQLGGHMYSSLWLPQGAKLVYVGGDELGEYLWSEMDLRTVFTHLPGVAAMRYVFDDSPGETAIGSLTCERPLMVGCDVRLSPRKVCRLVVGAVMSIDANRAKSDALDVSWESCADLPS